MSRRYNIVAPRPGREEGKTFWHRIGTAFENDRGGFVLHFDSLPIPDGEGKVKAMLFEADQNKGQQGRARDAGGYGGQDPSAGGGRAPMDDEIPFAPEWRV